MVDVTNIGTATGSTVSTVAITVPAGGVPKGALIIVCVADSSVSIVGGSVTDSKGNSYTRAVGADNNNATLNGFGAIFYSFNSAALVQNDTITYTLALTASAAITAFYSQSVRAFSDPLDSSATASATGSSTTPSVTSGSPSGSGQLVVGAVSNTGGSGESFTQDANAAWAAPLTRVGLAGGPTISGGSVSSGSSGALTYAPTLGVSHPWAAMIVAFKISQPAYNPNLGLRQILAR